jgi:tetratricopeptide (TPR) repeat protein
MKTRLAVVVLGLFLVSPAFARPSGQSQPPLAELQHDYNAGRYNRVVDVLLKAVEENPNDASLHFLMGESYYELQDYQKAINSLERAVQLSPRDANYHDWLGRAYGRKAEGSIFFIAMGLARKTHKEFETAVQLDPGDLEAHRDLIRYEMNAPGIVSGGDDRALKHIGDLEKIDPLEGQLARGEFLMTKWDLAGADRLFAQILESNTDRIGVYFEIADYYRDRQNIDKMAEAVKAAERTDQNDRRLKYYRGVMLVLRQKKPDEAEGLLRSYLATVPNNSDLPPHASALQYLGKLYESQSRFSEAAEEYRRSLELDPRNKSVQEALKRVEKK